jgi:hypothetical protein
MFAGALSGPGSARAIFTMDRVQPAKWLGRTLIALAVIIASAAALTFFISLDDYIPQIEAELSARLKDPVSIKSIRFIALPLHHFTVDGITIGRTDDITVGKVRLTPDFFSLLSPTRVIRSIRIDSLVLTQKGIDNISVRCRTEAAVFRAWLIGATVRQRTESPARDGHNQRSRSGSADRVRFSIR